MTTGQKFTEKIDGENEEFTVVRDLGNGYVLANSSRYGNEVFSADEIAPIATKRTAGFAQTSGLGIGGCGSDDHNIKYYEHEFNTVKTGMKCRRCHCYESDGANFTTLPDSGICDDCL